MASIMFNDDVINKGSASGLCAGIGGRHRVSLCAYSRQTTYRIFSPLFLHVPAGATVSTVPHQGGAGSSGRLLLFHHQSQVCPTANPTQPPPPPRAPHIAQCINTHTSLHPSGAPAKAAAHNHLVLHARLPQDGSIKTEAAFVGEGGPSEEKQILTTSPGIHSTQTELGILHDWGTRAVI